MLSEVLRHPIVFYGAFLLMAVISAATGIAGAPVLIPLSALQFGAKTGLGILTIFGVYQNINKMFAFRNHIQWTIGWRVIAWSLPGVLIGTMGFVYVPAEIFKNILAIGMLIYLTNDLLKIIPQKNGTSELLPLLSFLYGFLSGFLGSGNIIKGPMFTGLGLRKEMYLGTYAFTSIFINVPKVILLSLSGIIVLQSWIISLPLFVISVVGTYTGRYFLRGIPEQAFYYIVTVSFFLSAIALLLE